MTARTDELWDAIVVGAGPAGGLSSLQLAQRGRRVLLVEAKRFPRDKVCGGCLNLRAWSVLAASGLAGQVMRAGAVELDRLHLVCGKRAVDWPMPPMRALSRRGLDEVIVSAATGSGAEFAEETHATITPAQFGADSISVQLKRRDGRRSTARAKVVIAADGLSHSSLSGLDEARSRVAAGSRVGLGATFDFAGSDYPAGRLSMVVGASGYVGLTRVERGRLNVAAALSPSSLRAGKRPGEIVASLLDRAGQPVPEGCHEADWVGTPPLTRESRRWSARRVFLVGDATGYVEPFTGEGMSWALAGAVEVSQFAERAIESWSDDLAGQWHALWRRHVRRRQATCRGLAWLLRRPRLAEVSLAGAWRAPWLAGFILRRVSGSSIAASSFGK
ncbi:MAG: NAD(P)/FAD-dependent oxidoreductase [Aureliella sp.]